MRAALFYAPRGNAGPNFPAISVDSGGIALKTGQCGRAQLVSGSAFIADSSVTANTLVFLSCSTAFSAGPRFYGYVLNPGVGFTINAYNGTTTINTADNGVIDYIQIRAY